MKKLTFILVIALIIAMPVFADNHDGLCGALEDAALMPEVELVTFVGMDGETYIFPAIILLEMAAADQIPQNWGEVSICEVSLPKVTEPTTTTAPQPGAVDAIVPKDPSKPADFGGLKDQTAPGTGTRKFELPPPMPLGPTTTPAPHPLRPHRYKTPPITPAKAAPTQAINVETCVQTLESKGYDVVHIDNANCQNYLTKKGYNIVPLTVDDCSNHLTEKGYDVVHLDVDSCTNYLEKKNYNVFPIEKATFTQNLKIFWRRLWS